MQNLPLFFFYRVQEEMTKVQAVQKSRYSKGKSCLCLLPAGEQVVPHYCWSYLNGPSARLSCPDRRRSCILCLAFVILTRCTKWQGRKDNAPGSGVLYIAMVCLTASYVVRLCTQHSVTARLAYELEWMRSEHLWTKDIWCDIFVKPATG